MIHTRWPRRSLAALLVLFGVWLPSAAWAFDDIWTGAAGDSNWMNPGNWQVGEGVPDSTFEDVGIINNGDTAFIATTAPDAAGLILGQNAGDVGGLEIRAGGSINFVDSSGAPDGTANIGLDGIGTLAVRRGGTMSTTLLDVNLGSSVLVGTDAGAGFASLTSTGGMFLNGTTTVRGAGHTFSTMGDVTFEGNSTLVAQITSTSHTPLQATGGVAVNGEFKLQFGDGFTPAAGNAWSLVDAASITGAFTNIDTSAVPSPAPGTAYQIANIPGGTNGRLLQLQLNRRIVLSINTDTNAVTMSSPSGAINIDGYRIASSHGILNPAQWNSLQDHGFSGWQEASPTSLALSELNSNVGGSLAVGTSTISLGTPYTTPATFGQAPDVQFKYTSPTGEIVDGLIEYTGTAAANNLLLTIDPTTGAAQLRNSSKVTLQLVGYSVLSQSGSLLPNNGDWLSLDDQNVGSWLEANPTANALNEFFGGAGSTTLSPGASLNLGNPFNETGGAHDLALEFALNGEATPRVGAVQYAAISLALPGDYNQNGVVDAADYVWWRKNDGTPAGYNTWRAHFGQPFGSGSAVTTSSVPEPSPFIGLIFAIAMLCSLRRTELVRRVYPV